MKRKGGRTIVITKFWSDSQNLLYRKFQNYIKCQLINLIFGHSSC